MPNTSWRAPFAIGVVFIVLGALAVLLSSRLGPSAPAPEAALTATSTETTATTTLPQVTSTTPLAPAATFALDPRDSITSWAVAGAYVADPLSKQVDIAKLSSQIDSGAYPNYDLFVGIGQDYELIGDGHSAFTYYLRAVTTNPSRGLAYDDIGNLMVRLGALHTARSAYIKAVTAEPSVSAYQFNYLDFLTAHDPLAAATAKAFVSARRALDASPDFLIHEATWLGAIGNTTAAIADWEAVKPFVSPAQQAAIDATIAKLRSATSTSS